MKKKVGKFFGRLRNIGNSYFLPSKVFLKSFLLDIGVFFWGNTWIETFFIKFEVNIEYIRGEAENISILTENLMKKVEIQGVFPDGNTNEKEKL